MKATPILEELKIAAEAASFYCNDPADALQVQNALELLDEDVVPGIYEVMKRYDEMLEALRYIAGLDTSQDASPAQCSAVAVAMEAIDKATK